MRILVLYIQEILYDICLLQLGKFMYRYKYSVLPERFKNTFQQVNQIHVFNTRKSFDYRVPLWRTNIRRFSVYFQGTKSLTLFLVIW